MVEGQDAIEQALPIGHERSCIGGVIILGGNGTANSISGMGLHQVMSPTEVIKGVLFDRRQIAAVFASDFLCRHQHWGCEQI